MNRDAPILENADGLRIAVLLSGRGSSLENLIARIADGRLPNVRIGGVISSRSTAQGLQHARRAEIPSTVIRVKDYPTVEDFSEQIARTLDGFEVNLGVQAGWLCYWCLPRRWLGRVINLHPALLPRFGGQGYFGRRVHEAVLAAGETKTGATVHWVDNAYDHGKIILQQSCAVKPDDTPESLAERVQEIERALLPSVLLCIADGSIR